MLSNAAEDQVRNSETALGWQYGVKHCLGMDDLSIAVEMEACTGRS